MEERESRSRAAVAAGKRCANKGQEKEVANQGQRDKTFTTTKTLLSVAIKRASTVLHAQPWGVRTLSNREARHSLPFLPPARGYQPNGEFLQPLVQRRGCLP